MFGFEKWKICEKEKKIVINFKSFLEKLEDFWAPKVKYLQEKIVERF